MGERRMTTPIQGHADLEALHALCGQWSLSDICVTLAHVYLETVINENSFQPDIDKAQQDVAQLLLLSQPSMNTQEQKHTPREVADFIVSEILQPFTESSLYEDYEKDYIERTGKNDFSQLYDAAFNLIAAAPDSLEAHDSGMGTTNAKPCQCRYGTMKWRAKNELLKHSSRVVYYLHHLPWLCNLFQSGCCVNTIQQ
jgi:hypothetical protein